MSEVQENTTSKWYSLRVISGKEKKIKEKIELEVQRNKWDNVILNIVVPIEKVFKMRNGKKQTIERNILPGYILVEAEGGKMTGEMIQGISSITNVIHFLGRNKPLPMTQAEANRMLGKVDESSNNVETMLDPFVVNESVKIIDGPFNDFNGEIKEINEEKRKLKVIVKIFGRGTEVELSYNQVEKHT